MRRDLLPVALAVLVAACTRAPANRVEASRATAVAAPIDSLRGVIRISGSEPLASVTIEAGGETWLVDSAASPATPLTELRNASGLEVTLVGVADSTRRQGSGPVPMRAFRLERFFVRAVDGQSAVDGILVQEPSGVLLRLSDGTSLPIAALPPALTSQIGARIYWAGSTAEPPTAYGVLRVPSR